MLISLRWIRFRTHCTHLTINNLKIIFQPLLKFPFFISNPAIQYFTIRTYKQESRST